MKTYFSLAILLFTFNAQAADTSAYDRVIVKNEIVCGVIPWAPYKILDPNTGEWSGFGVELYRRAFATLDLKTTFKEVVLGNQVQDLNTGRVDAICDDGPWTMSAAKFVDYSIPAYASIVYPYMRVGETRIKSRADLNKKEIKFVGIDGDLSSDLVQRLFPNATFQSMPSTTDVSQLFLNVATKKADVAIVDPASFTLFEANNKGKLKSFSRDEPLGKYRQVVSVKKGDTKMLNLINQALTNAHDFGITDDVLNEFDPTHEKLMRVRSPYTFK